MITAVRTFVVCALMGLILVTVGVVASDWRGGPDVEIAVLQNARITVSIDGAVASPGVVDVAANARLNDAITEAGGLTADADVAGFNLAARVGDGEHIIIPSTESGDLPNPVASPAVSPLLIDINTASAAELDQLPGIGEVLAARIIEYRERHGRFTSIDQLIEVEGISGSTIDELRDLVTVGG